MKKLIIGLFAFGFLFSGFQVKAQVNNIPLSPVVVKNFNSAFLLISPNPSDQRTTEYKNFLENLKPKFEQSFKEATYNAATVKVEDIFVTSIGSENYLNNPSQIQQDVYSSIKELIAKKGDKYDFVNVFVNYDPKLPGNFSYMAKNDVKNIGLNIFDNTSQYGSSGKLIGITIQGDILLDFQRIKSFGVLSEKGEYLFGIGNMLHEVGHFWGCSIGGSFVGNGDQSVLEICNNTSHLYEGLESPAGTQDVLGTVPWLYNQSNDTYYQDHTGDYPLRYHPFFLYLMGLLSKDQYGTDYKIFNVGKGDQTKDRNLKIYKKVSVNDIINFAGERRVGNVILDPIDAKKDTGCSYGRIFSYTTGQRCPNSNNPTVIKVTCPYNMPNPYAMCSDGNMVPDQYDSNECVISYKCLNSIMDTGSGCSYGAVFNTKTGQRCSSSTVVTDSGCTVGRLYSITTGRACSVDSSRVRLTRTWRWGDRGDEVKIIQRYFGLYADGVYGRGTVAKVKAWQASNGLYPDGSFGPISRKIAGLE